jgi:hypothetical protein
LCTHGYKPNPRFYYYPGNSNEQLWKENLLASHDLAQRVVVVTLRTARHVGALVVTLVADHHVAGVIDHLIVHQDLVDHLAVVHHLVVDMVTHQDDLVEEDVDVKNHRENSSMYHDLLTVQWQL